MQNNGKTYNDEAPTRQQEHQHGFVKFKSCITNLLEALDIITETLMASL